MTAAGPPRSWPVAGGEVIAAVRRAAGGNPLLEIGPAAGGDRPTAELVGGDRRVADELVAAVGGWIGTDERRVAASLALLGYSARLIGPVLATLLAENLLLDARVPHVAYAFDPVGGFRLGLVRPAGWRAAHPAAGPALLRACREQLDDHFAAVIVAVRVAVPVASGLLWGNVASSAAGSLRALAAGGAVPAGTCYAAGRELFARGPLAGSGRLTLDGTRLAFRRRSCCLYYRLDGGGTCGDCPLPGTVTRYRRA